MVVIVVNPLFLICLEDDLKSRSVCVGVCVGVIVCVCVCVCLSVPAHRETSEF